MDLETELKKIPERVADGAKWMDEHHPIWTKILDIPSLNMHSYEDCVIGQVVSNEFWGVIRSALLSKGINPTCRNHEKFAADYGFGAPVNDNLFQTEIQRYYVALDQEWGRVYKERNS